MPRLFRPHIDLETKLRVLLRDLGDAFPEDMVEIAKEQRCLGTLVKEKEAELAALLGCKPDEIDYDHDPALGAREKVFDRFGVHVEYRPAANDPDHLFAKDRTRHRLKTNVKGDHGQHPDRVLIKKQRRREREAEVALGLRKMKPKAVLRSANRWPAKGARKINWRKP